MTDQYCKHLQVLLRRLLESQNTALLSLSVLHFGFCPVATLGNALAIRALWKASSLPPNLRKLLLSLAFCDLAVGLFAHPTFAAVFVISAALQVNVQCQPILTISLIGTFCLVWASFLNVTAIAVDRLLAISLHLRYAELVTSKRVTIILVGIWLISCVFSLVCLKYDYFVAVPILGSSGSLLTTFVCVYVYVVARYHQNQIQAQFLRERKSALNVVYIYIVFAACYLPKLCSTFDDAITGNPSLFTLFALFFVFLNSSLNPLVYCWRLRAVRQIMKDTLKKIFLLIRE
ncbi:PREDICTED: adenosine receptor A2b-like isoform X3 [Acropora digitifera]|uniref:adenosine receptor A2b-like isoform X2 n=1 Tax=Acropora digitifera TaxID=70779 RepID=UPI00077A2D66|nr:PREDICTED: adenosine receptor A2b-like isoform X2 [Acropora digitifera]XP_015771873.1 PREDICTED: adenosine receptor A2b-like isoform X3 [Acropora digitifera]